MAESECHRGQSLCLSSCPLEEGRLRSLTYLEFCILPDLFDSYLRILSPSQRIEAFVLYSQTLQELAPDSMTLGATQGRSSALGKQLYHLLYQIFTSSLSKPNQAWLHLFWHESVPFPLYNSLVTDLVDQLQLVEQSPSIVLQVQSLVHFYQMKLTFASLKKQPKLAITAEDQAKALTLLSSAHKEAQQLSLSIYSTYAHQYLQTYRKMSFIFHKEVYADNTQNANNAKMPFDSAKIPFGNGIMHQERDQMHQQRNQMYQERDQRGEFSKIQRLQTVGLSLGQKIEYILMQIGQAVQFPCQKRWLSKLETQCLYILECTKTSSQSFSKEGDILCGLLTLQVLNESAETIPRSLRSIIQINVPSIQSIFYLLSACLGHLATEPILEVVDVAVAVCQKMSIQPEQRHCYEFIVALRPLLLSQQNREAVICNKTLIMFIGSDCILKQIVGLLLSKIIPREEQIKTCGWLFDSPSGLRLNEVLLSLYQPTNQGFEGIELNDCLTLLRLLVTRLKLMRTNQWTLDYRFLELMDQYQRFMSNPDSGRKNSQHNIGETLDMLQQVTSRLMVGNIPPAQETSVKKQVFVSVAILATLFYQRSKDLSSAGLMLECVLLSDYCDMGLNYQEIENTMSLLNAPSESQLQKELKYVIKYQTIQLIGSWLSLKGAPHWQTYNQVSKEWAVQQANHQWVSESKAEKKRRARLKSYLQFLRASPVKS